MSLRMALATPNSQVPIPCCTVILHMHYFRTNLYHDMRELPPYWKIPLHILQRLVVFGSKNGLRSNFRASVNKNFPREACPLTPLPHGPIDYGFMGYRVPLIVHEPLTTTSQPISFLKDAFHQPCSVETVVIGHSTVSCFTQFQALQIWGGGEGGGTFVAQRQFCGCRKGCRRGAMRIVVAQRVHRTWKGQNGCETWSTFSIRNLVMLQGVYFLPPVTYCLLFLGCRGS